MLDLFARCRDEHLGVAHDLEVAIDRAREAERRLGEAEDKPAWEAAAADYERGSPAVHALEAEIPSPPQSFADVLAWAKLADFGADKLPDDDETVAIDEGDCFERPAVRLIQAVLRSGHRRAACRHAPREARRRPWCDCVWSRATA